MKKCSILILLMVLGNSISYCQSVDDINSKRIISIMDKGISSFILKIDTLKIKKLGFKNIDELNLIAKKGIKSDTILPTSILSVNSFKSHLSGNFYNYEYDGIFVIQTKEDVDFKTLNENPEQNLELFYTIRALEILKIRYSKLYQRLVSSVVYPEIQDYDPTILKPWYNRYNKIIISFNTGRNDIAISGTYLDPKPIPTSGNITPIYLYENLAIISINPKLIKGVDINNGSYPIYKYPDANKNYLHYLKEGLLHSICHELIHRYIDINNVKIGSIFNYLSFGNGRNDRESPKYDKHLYNLEEVIVNRTLDNYFKKNGGLSEQILKYYFDVETDLLNNVENLEEYKKELLNNSYINKDLSLIL